MSKKLIVALLAVLLAFGAFACKTPDGLFPQTGGQKINAAAWTGHEGIKTEYCFGETLSVPDMVFQPSGGGAISAETELLFPDGTATRNKEVILNRLGNYTLVYRAQYQGAFITDKTEFKVYNELFSVSSRNSSVSAYGGHNHTYFTNSADTSITETETVDGIKVSLSEGDILRFNRPIDVSENGPLDAVVRLCFTPSVPGEIDFSQLFFELRDAYDPTNFVTVFAADWGGYTGGVGVKAAFSGLTPKGVQRRAAFNDEKLWSGTATKWGTNANGSLRGYRAYPTCAFAFGLDYKGEYKNVTVDGGSNRTVIGLANPADFGRPWAGFTTGEAYVSIRAAEYQFGKTTAEFIITEINGESLSGGRVEAGDMDSKITVDIPQQYKNNLPVAAVNKPYPVFPATGRHVIAGELFVDVSVYMDYRSPTPKSVSLQDGFFTPSAPGPYSIVYTADAGNGKPAKAVLDITAVQNPPAIVMNTDSAGRRLSGTCGERIPVGAVTALSGGSGGMPSLRIYAEGGGTSYEVFNGYFGGLSAQTDLTFRAFSEGTYTVIYEAADYVGQTERDSYTVQVSRGTKPVFLGEPVLPKYLIAGNPCLLPDFTAYNYANGSGAAVPAEIRVSDAGGERVLTERITGGFKYTPQGAKGTAVTIKYAAAISGGTAELEYQRTVMTTATVVSAGLTNLDLKEYFKADNVGLKPVSPNPSSDSTTFVPSADGASLEFINPVLAQKSSVTFAFADVAGTSAPEIEVFFTDYADPWVKLKFTLTRGVGGSIFCQINDEPALYPVNSATFSDGKDISLAFNNMTGEASFNGSTVYAVSGGKAFGGFPSGKVYVSFRFKTLSGGLSFVLKNINGQKINNANRINEFAAISFTPVYGEHEVGDVITIEKAFSAGVIDPFVDFTMTVYEPGGAGTVAKDIDGLPLKDVSPETVYRLQLDKIGDYIVSYSARNSSGRLTVMDDGFLIRVSDREKPVITVKSDEIRPDAKKGTAVYVPPATATDNIDGKVDVKVYIIDPKGVITPLNVTDNISGESTGYDGFTASQTGVWIIRYAAWDSSGNYASMDFAVTVREV